MKAKLKDLVEQGIPRAAIINRLGITRSQFTSQCKILGLDPKKTVWGLTKTYYKLQGERHVAKDLKWQAGIMDGEGYIGIAKQLRKDRPSPAFRACAQVSNTDLRIIKPFIKSWGGSAVPRPDKRVHKNWSPSYTWHCPDRHIKKFLECILPHLRAKMKQARLVLFFIGKKKSFKRYSLGQGYGSAPLGKEEIKFRESLWNKVRLLNKKGQYSRTNRKGVV